MVNLIVADIFEKNTAQAEGLFQWDYGQELLINGINVPDDTEVQFYQTLRSSVGRVKDGKVRIPDMMLQNAAEITAYIYVQSDKSGETILKIRLPIKARPKPEDYVLPDYTEYTRLLPIGGEPGQIPAMTKKGIAWGLRADGLQLLDNELQLLSGDIPIGQRVRLPASTGGGEIELRNNGTEIQWRYTNSNKWNTLVSLSELRGPAGETPEFEIREGHLFVKYKN